MSRIRSASLPDSRLSWVYDLFSPVTTRFGTGAFVYNPVTGTVTFSDANGSWDKNNWAPRAGFAFRPFERTVIRASYGIYYFPRPFALSPINQAGVGTQTGLMNGSFVATPFAVPVFPPTTTTPAPGATVPAPNIPLNVQTGLQTPYTQNYYFMVQQDITHGILFDAAYLGNVGRQLPYNRALNVAAPGTGLAGLPFTGPVGVTEIASGLTSNYNALHVDLTKRISRGVGFSAAYTWSKALDYGTNLLNPFSRAANYGPADWDRTHMLTISHLFEIPFGAGTHHLNSGVVGQILAGWQVSGLFQWGTGTPYSVLAPATGCNCPGVAAVFAQPTGFASINGQASFNPAFFVAPPAGTFGSSSRNNFRGPDLHTYNLTLSKSFRIAEQVKMEFRAEGYNILNSPTYASPYANLGLPNFGQPVPLATSLVNGFAPRTFLIGARVGF
jgi:hypothetical protein